MKKILEIRNLTKEYNGNVVLKGIDLDINENEFVTFLGPSGCGKTTTLKIIGGFETPSDGTVFMDGIDLTLVPAHKRNINTVFQRYALFPHLNVFENIAFGLRIKKMDENIIREKVLRMMKLVNLQGFENRMIDRLSGGQQQRVAIARALVNEPQLLLLDEPLAALDLKLRQEMQYELKEIQRNTGITFIFVTHDQEEALTMSDKIVVMDQGIIQQIGTPEDIYNEPINRFVAKFIGESNIIPGVMIKDYLVEFDGIQFECVDYGFRPNQNVEIVIRPEDIDIVDSSESNIVGVVDSIAFKGVHYEIDVVTKDRTYLIHSTDLVQLNQKVGLKFNKEDIHVMEVTVFD